EMDGSCALGQWAAARLEPLGQIASARELLEEPGQARRLPARRRDECPVEEGRLAVAERRSVGTVDETACREQDGVACRRVPLAGRRRARIDVRFPFGNDAELER